MNATATKSSARWLAVFVMTAGVGTAIVAGSAVASADGSSDVSTNDIKIGNRSQFVQSADNPLPPTQQTSITGRPQTLVFKINRYVISNGPVK